MGPRKRSKPNPKSAPEAESQAVSGSLTPISRSNNNALPATVESTPSDKIAKPGAARTASDKANIPQSNRSWYGGSWSRKATPVAQVAKESISAAGGAASDAVASARAHTPLLPTTPLKSPTVYLSRSMGSSTRSLPLAATTTKLNISSNAPNALNGTEQIGQPSTSNAVSQKQKVLPDTRLDSVADKAEKLPSDEKLSVEESPGTQAQDKRSEGINFNKDSGSWLKWFSKDEVSKNESKAPAVSALECEQTDGTNQDSPGNMDPETSQDLASPSSSSKHRRNSEPSPVSPKVQQETQTRSWLGLWGNSTAQENSEPVRATGSATDGPANPEATAAQYPQPEVTDVSDSDPTTTTQPPSQPADVGKSYGWAFWTKDQSKSEDGQKHSTRNSGELAQAGSTSQSKPENAVVDKTTGIPNKVEKTQRPQSLDTGSHIKKTKSIDETGKRESKIDFSAVVATSKPNGGLNLKAKKMPDNLLLPSFKQTYSVATRPSLIQHLSRLLQLSSPPELRHLVINQSPPRIKRALAMGIHGYFPAPLIRSVLGQPTGTSIRFADSAASAIQKWTQGQNYSCEIDKVALEGEGKIAERIELLWKLMLNWIEKIRKADFVMIACHSQGVPVAMILVSKLIAFGCVNSARIGVCAMAGVNLGPFADYKSRWISGSAGELFEFAQHDSRVSKDYETALDEALKFGVKIVYIGSIDDQLVSLESSTFGTISHPNIYRAVFIDGRIHAPDFLSHLVGFALKLRNLGVSDHGLIRELSTPLAGSLYSGEGHSRIYEDEAVYYLAIQHALETTDMFRGIPLQTHRANPPTTHNPYILPFAMRGLLEEDYVRTELHSEITELIKQFDDWKPSSKVLKDVKFRLEGVRSKL